MWRMLIGSSPPIRLGQNNLHRLLINWTTGANREIDDVDVVPH